MPETKCRQNKWFIECSSPSRLEPDSRIGFVYAVSRIAARIIFCLREIQTLRGAVPAVVSGEREDDIGSNSEVEQWTCPCDFDDDDSVGNKVLLLRNPSTCVSLRTLLYVFRIVHVKVTSHPEVKMPQALVSSKCIALADGFNNANNHGKPCCEFT